MLYELEKEAMIEAILDRVRQDLKEQLPDDPTTFDEIHYAAEKIGQLASAEVAVQLINYQNEKSSRQTNQPPVTESVEP